MGIATENMTVEELAQMIHDAGKESVLKNNILNQNEEPIEFITWDDLPERVRKGRRSQAKFLLERLNITKK